MKKLSRRDLLKIGAGAVGGGLAGILLSEVAPHVVSSLRAKRPNVLIILLDALRDDHVGCSGYFRNTTPWIDNIAREGTKFEQMYASSSITVRSVPALLSSHHSPSHDPNWNWRLSNDFETLPQVFAQNGYDAKGMSVNPLVYEFDWNTKGFNKFIVPHAYPDEGIAFHYAEAYLRKVEEEFVRHDEVREPFFWYIHLIQPHDPYYPPEAYYSRFGSQNGNHPRKIYEAPWSMRVLERLAAEDIEHVESVYDANIRYGDWFVGGMINKLKGLGVFDKTLTVITSDHGEEFNEHGGFGHDGTVYEEDIHIPLIMRLPGGVPADRRVEDLASMVDIGPTILELTGLGREFGDGRSIVHLTEGSGKAHRDEVFSDSVGTAITTHVGKTKWRLICYNWEVGTGKKIPRKGWKILSGRPRELYDLTNDPEETRNIAGERAEVVEELEGRVRTYFEDAAFQGNPNAAQFDNDLVERIHQGVMERLQGGEGVDVAEVGGVEKDFEKGPDKRIGLVDKTVLDRLNALGYVNPGK